MTETKAKTIGTETANDLPKERYADPYKPGPLRDYLLTLVPALAKEKTCDFCDKRAGWMVWTPWGNHGLLECTVLQFQCRDHGDDGYDLPLITSNRDLHDSMQHVWGKHENHRMVRAVADRLGMPQYEDVP